MDQQARRIDWIEVGRGLAAFGVVLTHFNPWPHDYARHALISLESLGGYAVEFFFTLSGFIIVHVHRRDIGVPGALVRYGWRRLIRIYPTYWLVLLVALAFNQTLQAASAREAVTPGFLLHQLVILPGPLLIGPAWTLRHELLFYLFFAAIIARPRMGVAAFLAWMTAAAANLVINGLPPGQVSDPLGILLHHYNLDFLIGMAVALACHHGQGRGALIASLAAAVPPMLILWASGGASVFWQVLLYKPLFASLLTGAVLLSRRGVAAPAWFVLLGAMSYALYISHETVGIMTGGAFKRAHVAMSLPLLLAVKVVVALAAAYLLWRLFERPVLRRLRHATPRPNNIHEG